MSITLYTGAPGHGKTTALARKTNDLLRISAKEYKKYATIRKLYSNIKFSPDFYQKYSQYIIYYNDINNIIYWKDCDIIIDEMSLYFDSQNWERFNPLVKRYLRLHRHYGVNIYAAVQDFMTIDVTVRRLTTRLYNMRKLFGTSEPNPHIKQRFPFILSVMGEVKPTHYEIERNFYEYDSNSYEFFTSKDFSIFDTREDLPASPTAPKIYRKQATIYYDGDKIIKESHRFI
jgi:hypothetical protein